MLYDPVFDLFKNTYTFFFFAAAGAVVISTYIRVMVAALSASTDKVSAKRTCKTLLCSAAHGPTLSSVSKHFNRIIVVRIQVSVYICIIILPRCPSSLIFGRRDQTIRPVLLQNLFCGWRSPPTLPKCIN